MSLESLINKGAVVINPLKTVPEERTIVVLGVARGGTSIAAGALYHLGIPMPGAEPPVFEDVYLSYAFENKKVSKYRDLISKYNGHSVWAWKRPSSINYISKVEKEVRNPFYVVMFRDMASIGCRNSLSMKLDFLSSMEEAFITQKKILKFLDRTKRPALVCSVEKARQYPKEFIDSLIEFAHIETNSEKSMNAVNFLEPEAMSYIEASRITRSHGAIGGVKEGVVYGWAAWMYREEAVHVELYINNELKDVTIANEWRPHGKGVRAKRNGYCGFKFLLNKYSVQLGDVITIKVKGEIKSLDRSPHIIKERDLILKE